MAIVTTSGFPADNLGQSGDYAIDPVAHFIYGPKTSTWSGTASSLQGPSGPGMVYGNGAPTNNQGAIGQGYLDLSSGNFYGPKASNGAWGNSVYKLQGAPGAAGANGLSVLTGSGAPANTLGADGQVYIDTSVYTAYTKASGAWGTGTSLSATSSVSRYMAYMGNYWNSSYTANAAVQLQFQVQNVSNNGMGQTPGILGMTRSGSIVGYSLSQAGPVGGNGSIAVAKNGTNVYVNSNIGSGVKVYSGLITGGPFTFVAGDTLSVTVSMSAAGNFQCAGYLEIQNG